MANIGSYNTLQIVKEVDFGLYLDGGEHGEILLPKRYVPEEYKLHEELDVFIYFDSENRIIATTEKPFIEINKFAMLEVFSVTEVGAFLDWGLSKHLLLPFREQKQPVKEGDKVIVYLYLDDESGRLVASAKVDKFVDNLPIHYDVGQIVELLIYSETELGFKTIVDDLYWGMLYKNEIFQELKKGQRIDGYIKKVRDDEKIDVSLQKTGFEQTDEVSKLILDYLKTNNGILSLSDKSSPEEIKKYFQVSKKTFKKAIGNLYKRKLINLDDSGVRLIKK